MEEWREAAVKARNKDARAETRERRRAAANSDARVERGRAMPAASARGAYARMRRDAEMPPCHAFILLR